MLICGAFNCAINVTYYIGFSEVLAQTIVSSVELDINEIQDMTHRKF